MFFHAVLHAFSLHFFQAIGYNGAKKVVDVNFVAAWDCKKKRVKSLSVNSTKWLNTLKQFVGNSRQIV